MRPSFVLRTVNPKAYGPNNPFIPRSTFTVSQDIPRSYFLGHHREGLNQMKEMLSYVDLVIECRDFRVPHTSVNPLFEDLVKDKQRYIVFTKRDMGGDLKLANQQVERYITQWNKPSKVHFQYKPMKRVNLIPVTKYIKQQQIPNPAVGLRILVVGMPNVGKSTLINELWKSLQPKDVKLHNIARVGDHPGITRKIGTPVKLFDKKSGPVYIYDTPGVFVPQIKEPEDMVKLALCRIVKEDLISPITLADYVLYHLNKVKPFKYINIMPPTNDIMEFLTTFARRRGCLAKGGVPDIDRAARTFLHLYNQRELHGFVLDDIHALHKQWQTQRRALAAEKKAALDEERLDEEEQSEEQSEEKSVETAEEKTTTPAEEVTAEPAGDASKHVESSDSKQTEEAQNDRQSQTSQQSAEAEIKTDGKQPKENRNRVA